MDEVLICKLCGHSEEHHLFDGNICCNRCLGGECHNGPDGRRYRNEPKLEVKDVNEV